MYVNYTKTDVLDACQTWYFVTYKVVLSKLWLKRGRWGKINPCASVWKESREESVGETKGDFSDFFFFFFFFLPSVQLVSNSLLSSELQWTLMFSSLSLVKEDHVCVYSLTVFAEQIDSYCCILPKPYVCCWFDHFDRSRVWLFAEMCSFVTNHWIYIYFFYAIFV